MNIKKVYCFLLGITVFPLGLFWFLPPEKGQQFALPLPKNAVKVAAAPKPVVIKEKVTLKTVSANPTALKGVSFEELPGWDKADINKSFLAFQESCRGFIKQAPNHPVGSQLIALKAGDWHPACKAALNSEGLSESEARQFFEKWFNPIKFEQKKPVDGLFTGYYMPTLQGSLVKTKHFHTPIYGIPRDLQWNKSHYTRAQIDKGALEKKAPIIAWINSPVERLFLEIEGSGIIKLKTGKTLYVNYAAENGAPYTSIGSVLIKQGLMTKDNASKKAIKRYFDDHPNKVDSLLHKNESFVFFEKVEKQAAVGAKGMPLTPGYSLAIDRKWIPLGAPLWLNTKKPDAKKFQRLMIAQDTGGAIKGLMRGDVYWGSGANASFLGEHMKNRGRYWLLLPKRFFEHLAVRARGH